MRRRIWFSINLKWHATPLLVDIHWLHMFARFKFKSLMLAYRRTSGSAPIYWNPITGLCSFSATAFLQGKLSGIALLTHMAISVQTSRLWFGIPFYLRESVEDSSLLRAPPLVTYLTRTYCALPYRISLSY